MEGSLGWKFSFLCMAKCGKRVQFCEFQFLPRVLYVYICAISVLKNYGFCLIRTFVYTTVIVEQAPPSEIAGFVFMFVTAYLLNGTVTSIVAWLTVPVLKSVSDEGCASASSVRAITVYHIMSHMKLSVLFVTTLKVLEVRTQQQEVGICLPALQNYRSFIWSSVKTKMHEVSEVQVSQ